MTPTPPSTTSSSAGGHSPDGQYRVIRKRNRVPLSCAACRHRKLKCNRSHPCENCIRRGDAAGCSYATPGTRKRNQNQGSSSPDDMQNRIDRLEGLVLSLMTNGAQSAGPAAAAAEISRSTSESVPGSARSQELEYDDDMIREEDEDSEVDEVSNTFGTLKVDAEAGKAMYLGDNHWHTVLADIAEVKNYFINHKLELEAQYTKYKQKAPHMSLGGPTFLFGGAPPATEAELRAALPSNSVMEKLVSRYFNSMDPAVYILHYPTFYKELQQYFKDPSKGSIMWVALLYGVLTLAMQSYQRVGDEPPEWKGQSIEMTSEYRLRTVQCLVTGDCTKGAEYTIEALILYTHGEYVSRWDAEVGLWVIFGMTVRLAMRGGYHRDPKHFPSISPFHGEMRRRIWSFLRQGDIMMSAHLALPSMIKAADYDTEAPQNMFEDEFGPDTDLPPPRPNTEPTPVSYMIAKSNLAYVHGEVIDEINSICGHAVSYEDVMKKDQKIREIHNNMAPHLKLRRLEDCMLDPATLLTQRFYLDCLYQKILIVLHRKYIPRARNNPRYAHSRRTCVEASLELLKHQNVFHIESFPGGRLRTVRSFLSSLTKYDFLLAALVICLDLNYETGYENYERSFWTAEQKGEMLRALETSYKVWQTETETSMEAYKASKILGVMLEKLARPVKAETQSNNDTYPTFDSLQPEHSAAMTLGMLSSGGLTPNTAQIFGNAANMPPTPGGMKYNFDIGDPTNMTPNFMMDVNPIGNLNGPASPFGNAFGNAGGSSGLDIPSNIDWDAWDTYVGNGGILDPSLSFFSNNFDASTPAIPEDANSFSNSVFMGANTPGRM